jgi:hypothetical protein
VVLLHHGHCPGLADCPQRPGPLPHVPFTGPGAGGLHLILTRERRAGGRQHGTEQPQDGAGKGCEKNHCQGVCHHHLAVV